MPISPNDPDYNSIMARHRQDATGKKKVLTTRIRRWKGDLQRRLKPPES